MNGIKQRSDNSMQEDKLYFSSDGLAFLNETDAKRQAKSLRDKRINVMTRQEADLQMEKLLADIGDEESDMLSGIPTLK